MASDDSRLIQSALAGNRQAFGDLVLKYQDRLFGSLLHMLGSFHDARDATQDAFLLAFQKLHTFRQDASFYSWLFRIAYNAAISHRRKLQLRVKPLQSDSDDHSPQDRHVECDPAFRLMTADTTDQIRAALETLPPEYRDAIVLKEIEGFQYEEIAELLSCPVGTVRSRIFRARQLLRERLARLVEREQK